LVSSSAAVRSSVDRLKAQFSNSDYNLLNGATLPG
jgi:hypothetical protein